MKLHIGCGSRYIPGWTNLDINQNVKVDISDDARILNKVPNLSCDVNGAEREFISGAIEALKKTKYLYIEFCKTDNGELFEGAVSREEILELLPFFEEMSVYSFLGNYGNTLLRNRTL